MNNADFMKQLEAYGADVQGIANRFMGDSELYMSCYQDLFNDPNFTLLEKAVSARDYEEAFSAAHALKGLSANLGLTPLYQTVCVLVESLRAGQHQDLEKELREVQKAFQRLPGLSDSETPGTQKSVSSSAAPSQPRAGQKPVRRLKKTIQKKLNQADQQLFLIIVGFLVVIIAVSFLFNGLIARYQRSTVEESASHLIEINQELRLYVENKIEGDWNAAHSIANSVDSGILSSDETLLSYLERERNIWGVSNITIFTEDGYNLSLNGITEANDQASETIAKALDTGEFLEVKASSLYYVIPIDTDISFHGSRIIAISVVQSLHSFLDKMAITSFDGRAYLYLTQNNGVLISRLSHEASEVVYNLITLLQESHLQFLPGGAQSVDEMLAEDSSTVLIRETEAGDQYVVSTPIWTGYEEMRIFYFVPVAVVNHAMNSFSRYMVLLTVIVILAFFICAALAFLLLYNARKKKLNQALITREHMLDLLVRNTKNAFILLAVNQKKPLFVSSNLQKIIGEPYRDLIKTPAGVYHLGREDEMEMPVHREINEQLKGWDGKREFRSGFIQNIHSALPLWFEVQYFPVEGAGHDEQFVAIVQDITPLYERETAASEALVMAEEANQAKSHFLSNMSHDIRTPMNAIVNMVDFARESVGRPEEQKEYLDSLNESAHHLLQLINDVLDMSRIESGRMILASDPFNMRQVLLGVADMVRPLFAQKNQLFQMDFESVRSLYVLGDEVKLSQILLNLLSNANKFTPEFGMIRFTVEKLPSLREKIAALRFRVEDSGPGVAPDDLTRIFEPFARVDEERVSKVEGTGLGLSICRSYVKAMGGTIHCESQLGKGSAFIVELFFTITAAPVSAPVPEQVPEPVSTPLLPAVPPFEGKRCLLCEDNKINQQIAVKLLEKLGFCVEVADDGQAGLDLFLNSAPAYYDMIFMDVQMPVMDGYEATRTIRASAHPRAASIPIIAMTANVFAEDIEKAREAGMDGHLGKPIMVPDLMKTINEAIGFQKE